MPGPNVAIRELDLSGRDALLLPDCVAVGKEIPEWGGFLTPDNYTGMCTTTFAALDVSSPTQPNIIGIAAGSIYSVDQTAYLALVAVAREMRCNRIGSRLIEAFEQKAAAASRAKVTLTARIDDFALQMFYRSRGYILSDHQGQGNLAKELVFPSTH